MMRNTIVLIGIGLLLIGLFIFYKNRQSISPLSSSQEGTVAQIKILTEDEQKNAQGEAASYEQTAKWEREERTLDLKRMPLSISNGEASLNVEVVTKKTCFPGDANAIEMDLNASPDHRLLISLEPLSGKAAPLTWQLPKDFLEKESASHEFRLKVSDQPTQYGFYLCTARPGDSRCGGKPIKDINEIFTEHLRKDPHAGKETRNIFFQYLFVDNRGITTFSDYDIQDKKFDGLKKYVKGRQIQNKNFVNEIDLAKRNINVLLSHPLNFDGKTMKVELPRYSGTACALEN